MAPRFGLSACLAAAAAACWLWPERATSVVLLVLAGVASPPGVDAARAALAEAVASDVRGVLKGALVDAVGDAALNRRMARLIRESVADALRDEAFMHQFRDSLKDALQDVDLHRAAMQGAVGSLLHPFRRPSGASPGGGGGGA